MLVGALALLLCCALIAVASAVIVRRVRKRQRELQEVPDMENMPRCLSDVLHDKDITIIPMDEVDIQGEVGRGLPGLFAKQLGKRVDAKLPLPSNECSLPSTPHLTRR